jgi:hypothetical protein
MQSFSFYEFLFRGYAVAHLFEALRYKPESQGFDSRWCNWNLCSRTMAVGSTQPLTEMSTWGIKAAGRRADNNLTTFVCRLS